MEEIEGDKRNVGKSTEYCAQYPIAQTGRKFLQYTSVDYSVENIGL